MSLTSVARPAPRPAPSSALKEALAACSHAFVGVALMSGLINILYLTGSFYMLEVYDRVLPSRSVPTLVALSILAITLFAFQGVLDVIRSRVMIRIAATLDERLSGRVYDVVVLLPLRTRGQGDGLVPLRDLDQIRNFLVTPGPLALFDLPWMPIYVIICFLFHPWIGVAALVGAAVLTSLTLMSEFMTRGPARTAVTHGGTRNSLAEAGRRNAEALHAMGATSTSNTWQATNEPRTYPVVSAQYRRCCVSSCNRACSVLGPIWSSNSRPRPVSSSRVRSSWRAPWRLWNLRLATGSSSSMRARAGGACRNS